MKNNLGQRMKTYEYASRFHLIRKIPLIIRVDGKAFHTLTRNFKTPFDDILQQTMIETAKYLCNNIQGCKIGYVQSDEISLLVTDYDTIKTSAWFDYNIQKISSVSASMATLAFNKIFDEISNTKMMSKQITEDEYNKIYYHNRFKAIFDSRAASFPKEEVCNYFIWRQQDATRNSIQMIARAHFSHKQLNNKSCEEIQEMLFQEKGINFNDTPVYQKRGTCIIKEQYTLGDAIRNRWIDDRNIPIFSQNKEYIDKYVYLN